MSAAREDFDKIDLHLVRVLHTLIAERNVSRAALKLGATQPQVSAQLRRLRELTGDPLLVRAGNAMTPTTAALQMLESAGALLREADRLFSPRARPQGFEPATSRALFRIAASDYLDPLFLPDLVSRVRAQAPAVQLELIGLSGGFDYRRGLADGAVDLVIGNWLRPPDELHLGKLLADEVVCLVARDHPAVRLEAAGEWTVARYLGCQHVAPAPFHLGASGVIDDQLESLGLKRALAVRCAHFGQIPPMVARSPLVLTTGRRFCERYLAALPVAIVPCPAALPPLAYYQLWHDLTHASVAMRWLRAQVREVAGGDAGAAGAVSLG